VTAGGTNNATSAPITIYINEWMADNTHTLADPADNDFEDWIELYNPTAFDIDLGGYFLTDNLTNKFQYEVPSGGQYKVPATVICWSGRMVRHSRTPPTAPTCTSLSSWINSEKPSACSLADGTTIDAVSFGLQTNDVSRDAFPTVPRHLSDDHAYACADNFMPNTAPVLAPIANTVVTLGKLCPSRECDGYGSTPQTLTLPCCQARPIAPSSIRDRPVCVDADNRPATNFISVKVADNGTPS